MPWGFFKKKSDSPRFYYPLRKQKALTQKKVAAQLGVHATQLNKYEVGLHAPPPEKLVFLAEFFGVTVDHLLTGGATDTPTSSPSTSGTLSRCSRISR